MRVDLSRGYALSRTHQPAIGNLIRALSTSERVTLVVGAGFSIDAGLPSWARLMTELTDGLEPYEKALNARLDNDDPMRKAEWLVRMRLVQDQYGSQADLVRAALYQHAPSAQPGPLIRGLGDLIAFLAPKVSILTTNFDDMLEIGLSEHAVDAHSNVSVTPSLHLLDDSDEAIDVLSAEPVAGQIPIIHLHGYLPRLKQKPQPWSRHRVAADWNSKERIILTESEFLKYGPEVRKVVGHALNTSTVVFLGVSLTDPNLLGPLWDSRRRNKPAFTLTVPDRISKDVSWEVSRKFAIEKSEALFENFSVEPIFAKSYGQLDQLLKEITIGAKAPEAYLKTNSRISYGSRLRRHLRDAYKAIGCNERGMPVGEGHHDAHARALSQVKSARGQSKGLRGILLRAINDKDTQERLNELRRERKAGTPKSEEFALSVWLRVPSQPRGFQPYALRQVINSAYLLTQSGDVDSATVEAAKDSAHAAARALASNRAVIWNAPPENSHGNSWPGIVAVPLRIFEIVNGDRFPICIGAVCLHSTHHMSLKAEILDPGGQISIVSALTVGQRVSLVEELERAGRRVLSPSN